MSGSSAATAHRWRGAALLGCALALAAGSSFATGQQEPGGQETPTLSKAEATLAAARAAFGSLEPAEFVAGMEADRLLLSELRKDTPSTRAEAEVYLARLKELAGLSDPVRLVPRANRVLEQAPLFYDWLEKTFKDDSERVSEYYVGGAQGFRIAFEEFQNATLMTVINRLEIAARVLRVVDGERSVMQ